MALNKEDFAALQESVRQIENYLRSLMPKIVKCGLCNDYHS